MWVQEIINDTWGLHPCSMGQCCSRMGAPQSGDFGLFCSLLSLCPRTGLVYAEGAAVMLKEGTA